MSQAWNIYAGMQVNHYCQWEAWSVRQSGLVPVLLITHENGDSGRCEDWLFCSPCYFNRDLQWNVFIHAEAAERASSPLTGLWSCSLLKGLRRQQPKNMSADSLHLFSTPLPFSFSKQWGCLFPGIPTLQLERTRTRLRMLPALSVWKSWLQSQRFSNGIILETW